ncbi:MAG: lipid-A-disaccharide synthase [Candidatus Acidulodesulfobacterium sp.]
MFFKMHNILVVSGEPSGDVFAGGLISSLKKIEKIKTISGEAISLNIYAMGGKNSAEAGAELISDIKELSVMGFTEVLLKLKTIKKVLRNISLWIESNKPDAVILVDFPSFNFKIAKLANKLKIPVVYFIPPKIWASRYGRIKFIKKYIKFVITIFPFEQDIYKKEGVESYYFGNPLYVLKKKDILTDSADLSGEIETKKLLKGKYPVISFLPGSRKTELKYHAQRIIDSALRIKSVYKDAFFIFPFRREIDFSYFKEAIEKSSALKSGLKKDMYIFTDSIGFALSSSNLIITASGTASLEACFYGKPVIIFYYLNYLTYVLAKILVRIKYAGLINILAGEEVVPELIESKFNPENVFNEAEKFLKDEEYRQNSLKKISSVVSTLDAGIDPFDAAADVIYDKIIRYVR